MIVKNCEEYSRRLSTSGFSGNVIVTAETSYQMYVRGFIILGTEQITYFFWWKKKGKKSFPWLRKQPTFGDATTGFPTKWRLRNERRNSILMTRHYPDLSSASDWLNQMSHAARPIRSTTQIWVVTRHQYGISAFVSQTSFRGETSGSVARCRLFSQAKAFQVDYFLRIREKMASS